jgi:hypothetical protein
MAVRGICGKKNKPRTTQNAWNGTDYVRVSVQKHEAKARVHVGTSSLAGIFASRI